MLDKTDILNRKLKQGKDYIYIGNEAYEQGDKFLMGEKEIVVRKIIDAHHFFDSSLYAWHSFMFYDRSCCHCHELNQKKIDVEM